MLARHRRPLLGWLAVAAVALAGWLSLRPAQAQDVPEADAALVQRGAELYSALCATCHGASGQGGTIPGTDEPAPPLIGSGVAGVTIPYADLVMRTGRMPPPENDPFDNRARIVRLTDEERLAILAFLRAVFDMPGDVPHPPPGDPAEGQVLFAANCAPCHGSTGAGGVAGAGAWTPAVDDLEPPAIAEAIRVGPFEMPRFSEEQISDEEIGDIVAFLDFVDAEPGTPLGLIELNPVFASGFAAVFVLAVLVVVRVVAGKPAPLPDPPPDRDEDEA